MKQTRIDKWLWSIRAFKTRSMAAKACTNGKVFVNDKKVKASFQIQENMVVKFTKNKQTFVYKSLQIIDSRVGAPLAQQCYEDITPAEILEANKSVRSISSKGIIPRAKGLGRPTKKERRGLDRLWDDFDE